MSERGMKKWAPYASLIEQKSYLSRIRDDKRKVPRPHIASDQAAQIEQFLTHLDGKLLKIKYFQDGVIACDTMRILKVDPFHQQVIFDAITLPYRDILNIEHENQ